MENQYVTNKRSGKLIAETITPSLLRVDHKKRMFEVFNQYYENTTYQQFISDLKSKEVVFLLKDSSSFEIMGFSTILSLNAEVDGRMIRGLFSGDTIIEKKYWGQGVLGVAFLKYLFVQKLKNPLRPLYWFLISKGYKTYLLMANNFPEHYPRFEKKTPEGKKKIIDCFARELYRDYYSPVSGVISFNHSNQVKDHLKCEVTPITRKMMLENPRIKFFADLNPEWEKGDELACIAKMTFTMPLHYQFKIWKKQILKFFKSTGDYLIAWLHWLQGKKVVK